MRKWKRCFGLVWASPSFCHVVYIYLNQSISKFLQDCWYQPYRQLTTIHDNNYHSILAMSQWTSYCYDEEMFFDWFQECGTSLNLSQVFKCSVHIVKEEVRWKMIQQSEWSLGGLKVIECSANCALTFKLVITNMWIQSEETQMYWHHGVDWN